MTQYKHTIKTTRDKYIFFESDDKFPLQQDGYIFIGNDTRLNVDHILTIQSTEIPEDYDV